MSLFWGGWWGEGIWVEIGEAAKISKTSMDLFIIILLIANGSVIHAFFFLAEEHPFQH